MCPLPLIRAEEEKRANFTALRYSEAMYKQGGLFSVTSRILVVDMLNKVIPVELVTGIVVLHAET